MKPEHHISHVKTFFNCPEQYRRRYILGHKIMPNRFAVRGKAVHKTIDANLTYKKDHGELLPLEHVTELARDAVVKDWAEGVMLGEDSNKSEQAMTIDSAVALSQLHHSRLAPEIEPVEIEWPWNLECEGYDFTLGGTVDIIEPYQIRDTKTTSRKKAVDYETYIQMSMYSLAVKHMMNVPAPPVVVDYLLDYKKPDVITTDPQPRTEKDFRVLLFTIQKMTESIKAGNFNRAAFDNYRCSPTWCGYWDSCKYQGN